MGKIHEAGTSGGAWECNADTETEIPAWKLTQGDRGMASRTNGPICVSKLGTSWIDSGTSVLTRSEPPGPLGLASNGGSQRLVVPNDVPHRLLLAARNGIPYLAPELRDQIAAMLTLENFAFLAGFLAADIAFAGTGIGTVINVVAGGLVIVFVGTQAISSGKQFLSFYRKASIARSQSEFQAAGQEFAKAVALLGVATVAALLTRRGKTKSFGTVASTLSKREVEASWLALADSIEFNIPAEKGVIYAGVSQSEAVEAIANSRNPQGKVINDIATKYGWTQENMEADFGKDFSATTYRLWEYLSIKYQQALKGRVVAYIDSSRVRLDNRIFGELGAKPGAGPEVEITDGKYTPSVILTELEELMTSNRNVTSIVVKDVKTGQSWLYTPGSKSRLSH